MLGLVANPVAGMGGAVGLRGTDGDAADRARGLGACPQAGDRLARALARLARGAPDLRVLAAASCMGADLARAQGWQVQEVPRELSRRTTAEDTRAAALQMRERGVALLLFAGGDGTACDILSSVGTTIPVLGVPTGVKMHSGVFATSPEGAGDVAARYLTGTAAPLREVEVLDVDEQARREDRLDTRLHGIARVPDVRERMQRSKSAPLRQDDADLDAACQCVAQEMRPGHLYVLGPGTTTRRVLDALGLSGSLTGVDAVLDGRLVGRDINERQLLDLLADGRPAVVVLGVIGGQGFLLGRGNQQISRAVLERAGGNLIVIASAEKLARLDPAVLHVDLDDAQGAALLAGYRRVRTGPRTSTVLRVVT